jgi:beta-1,4-glucosyltransferase
MNDIMPLAGFNISVQTSESLCSTLLVSVHQKTQRIVFFANTNFVVQCQSLRPRIVESKVLLVNDGVGIDLASWLVHGRKFVANLNGTDFIPYLCRHSLKPLRLFLLGGNAGIVDKASEYFERDLGQKVVGLCDGYAQLARRTDVVDWINAVEPDVLLVAFGNPLQEAWILEHHRNLRVPVMMGVGALFDFLSGHKQRAPDLVQKLRLEWLFRLCLEPRRLMRRYTLDILVFMGLCLRGV